MREVGIAVVGCGYWGQNLVRNFWELEDARVRVACDTSAEALSRTNRRYPTIELSGSFEDAIRHPAVDAVVLATPVSTHYPLAKLALNAGKHVLVEKPLAEKSSQVFELTEIAERQHRVLMVDHTFLYSPAVQRMKELIESGEIGELLYYDSVRINLGLVQSDTNVLWDLGPHDFAIMDFLCGQKPRSVTSTAVRHMNCPYETMAYVTARFDSSLVAHFHLNWLAPVKVRRTLIGGSKKMIVYDDMEPSEKVKVYDRGFVTNHSPERRARILTDYRNGDMQAPHLEATEALRRMAREFIDSVRRDRSPLTNGEAAGRVVQLLEAAQQSISNGGREVTLPAMGFASASMRKPGASEQPTGGDEDGFLPSWT